MADKGIIFSAPMVRALLAGRKTQTRRIITKPAALDALAVFKPGFLLLPGNVDLLPYAPGDRLYVREAHYFNHYEFADQPAPKARPAELTDEYLCFRATEDDCEIQNEARWRPSIHMPRWASRMWLGVTDVRVQRLQEISEEDAEAEGYPGSPGCELAPSEWFTGLWNSLHEDPGTRWDDNPWIVAVSFDVHHGNIDKAA